MVTWLHLNDNNCGWQANQIFFFFKGNLYLVVHDLALSTDSFFKGPYRKANIIIFAKLHILFVTWRNWIGLFYVRHFHCRWRVSEWTKNLHSNIFLKPPQFLQYYINFLHGFWRILPNQRHVALAKIALFFLTGFQAANCYWFDKFKM